MNKTVPIDIPILGDCAHALEGLLLKWKSKGHKLKIDDLAIKSPGGGMPPYKLKSLIGKVIKRDLEEEEIITIEDLL